jgi:hypothetical protein
MKLRLSPTPDATSSTTMLLSLQPLPLRSGLCLLTGWSVYGPVDSEAVAGKDVLLLERLRTVPRSCRLTPVDVPDRSESSVVQDGVCPPRDVLVEESALASSPPTELFVRMKLGIKCSILRDAKELTHPGGRVEAMPPARVSQAHTCSWA